MKKLLMAMIPLVISLQFPSWNADRLPAEWVDTLQYGKRWIEMMYYASSAGRTPVAEASVSATVSAGHLPQETAYVVAAHLTGLHPEMNSLPTFRFEMEDLDLNEHKFLIVRSELEGDVQQVLKDATKRLVNIECELRRKVGKNKVLEIPDIRVVLPSI